MSINEYMYQNAEQPVFYLLTFEITQSHLVIPMEPLVFSAVSHTIKCVTIKIKRNLTAGNGKVPSVLVPQAIFIKLINLSPILRSAPGSDPLAALPITHSSTANVLSGLTHLFSP